MKSFNLGLFQKKFNSTSRVTTATVNMGCMRGRGSTTRMFNYCKQHSDKPALCIDQFVNLPLNPNPKLYSKNNTSSDGFPIGAVIDKDMDNYFYAIDMNPVNYPNYFPGMAAFVPDNIVLGNKPLTNRLVSSYWNDWGDDIFDGWGFFYIYDVLSGQYFLPIISPQNTSDGQLNTQIFEAFGRTFTIKQGYPVQGIFKFDISVNDNKPFIFGCYGNMGYDENHTIDNLTYKYNIDSNDLTLYYIKQGELGDNSEVFYSYFIPQMVPQNNETQSYQFFKNNGDDNTSLMSKTVTNGLLVYFSKQNDVKLWVVNDLGIQN